MSDFKLALTYLRSRALITALTVASVALGLALATIVLMLTQQTKQTLASETAYWDVAVGAKGSPLQLVLNSMYYLDAPTGNINISVWKHLQADRRVARVVPVSMGDNYFGVPIVGTTPDLFAERTSGRLVAQGRMFTKPFEAVIGADIARRFSLRIGSKVVGSHGWTQQGQSKGEAHEHSPYTVVGVLAPTASSLDRGIYTDYRSVWEVHAHHHDEESAHEEDDDHHAQNEVTALLVRLAQTGARYRFIEGINKTQPAMAAIPVDEISKVEKTFIAPLQGILLVVAYMVVIVSALSILISLYLTIHQRRRDLAILRSLGATQGDVFRLITLEAALLSGIGVLAGWGLGHALIALASSAISARFGISVTAWTVQPVELVIAVSVWALGILAGLLPAIMAYRLPVADTLTKE